MEKNYTHIDHIKGKKKGPCVLIIGAIHGNERIGKAVILKLLHRIKPKNLCGELIVILGNPAAYAVNKRYINSDLNRLFSSSQIKIIKNKPIYSLNVEEKRALEIEPYLKKADYLLDIHSTIKPSVPFIYCEKTKEHFNLAQLFNIQYIVSGSSKFKKSELVSCADSYVNKHGGKGITYETGWHKNSKISQEIMNNVYQFLQAVGSLKLSDNLKKIPKLKSKTKITIYEQIVPQTTSFHFKKDFSNFNIIEKGEIIAQDNEKIFEAKKKSFIIFPKLNIIPNKPACYLGSKNKFIN